MMGEVLKNSFISSPLNLTNCQKSSGETCWAFGLSKILKKGGYIMAKLNRREQTIMNYMQNGGNIKKAMIDAGYSETYADRNSKYLLGIIGDEIKKAQENIRNDNIKSIEEVQQWWSEVMDDNEENTKNRLRASELLVKSKGGFIEKMEVTAKEDPFDKLKVEELRQLIDDD